PVIQAPMAGANATPPALVAAVSNAGALGFIGAAYMTAEQIGQEAAAIRALTDKPFGINLFAPIEAPRPTPEEHREAARRLAPFHAELGIAHGSPMSASSATFEQRFVAAMDSGARIFSFTFGLI